LGRGFCIEKNVLDIAKFYTKCQELNSYGLVFAGY
jgi:hypothetical protein